MANALDVIIRYVGDATGAVAAAKETEAAYSKTGNALVSTGKKLSLALTLPLAAAGVAAIKELENGAKVAAQTNAVIKSTGGVANVSAKQVDELAQSLMRKSGTDDEAIKSGENLLLTFTHVRNEAGKGNDIFNQATTAALDLSVAFGKDMSESAILVGKALNNPIEGLGKLQKVGVTFTQTQKDQIANFVAMGDTLSAQKVILKELETQVGGSAAAFGKTLPGQVAIAKESLMNAGASIVAVAAPALDLIAQGALKVANVLSDLPPAAQAAVGGIGVFLALLGPAMTVIGNVAKVVKVLGDNLSTLGKVAQAGTIVGTILAIGFALDQLAPKNEEARKLADAARESGKEWAKNYVAVVTATTAIDDSITRLTGTLNILQAKQSEVGDHLNSQMSPATQALAGDFNKLGQEYANLQGKTAGLKQAISELQAKQVEQQAAAAAQEAALAKAAQANQGVATATQAARQAVTELNNAFLAAEGGELGYQAAQLQVEAAQKRVNDAVAQFGPDSLEARQAANELAQAKLSAANAAYTLQSNEGTLSDILQTKGVAGLVTLRNSLQATISKHGDATGAVQAQIDKINDLIATVPKVPADKTTTFHVEKDEATRKAKQFNDDADNATRDRTANIKVNAIGNPDVVTRRPGFGPQSYATGGVVPGPRGMPQLAIVHGGEKITPAGASSSPSSSSSTTYNINVDVAPGVNPVQVGAQIVDQIRQYERVSGKAWRS